MTLARRLFRRSAWLALVAMIGLALVPTLSHALATRLVNAQPWSELCSIDAAGDAGSLLAHCPLCAQSGNAPALPGTPRDACLPAQAPDMVAQRASASAGMGSAWVAPPSRAPPRA